MTRAEKAQAEGMLRIAVRRMATAYPFHAHLLSLGRFSADTTVSTMGVTMRNAHLLFLFSPAFVCRCNYDELVGLLHHEVNHILFGHLLAAPGRYPDTEARIIAEEVTANEWINEPLPGRPLTLEQFPDLPRFEDTEQRYVRLARKSVQRERKTGQSGRKTGPSVPNSGSGVGNSFDMNRKRRSVTPLDNHEIWREARKNEAMTKLVISSVVRQAWSATSNVDWLAIPADTRQRIQQLSCGIGPERDTESLTPTERKNSVNWRSVLRRCIANTVQRRPAFHRPPRRLPHLVGVVPAYSLRFAKPVVMAVIDTSESMDAEILEIVSAELGYLARDYDVVIVECDAEIQGTYAYRGPIKSVRGRGGTDLRPPFERQFFAKIRPDVILYFTDGDGPVPDTAPKTPTIWCLTPDGERPAAWGLALTIE